MSTQLTPATEVGAIIPTDVVRSSTSRPVPAPTGPDSIGPISPIGPISHNERFQLLVSAARKLREETLSELDALSACCTPDEFCTGCCQISKEITCLSSALSAGQWNIRCGSPFRGHLTGERALMNVPSHRPFTNRKPKL